MDVTRFMVVQAAMCGSAGNLVLVVLCLEPSCVELLGGLNTGTRSKPRHCGM